MDNWIYENRRKWLAHWIEQAKGRSKFEEKYGYTRSQIAQFLSADYNEGRSIGDIAARRIEKRLGVPDRSMDAEFVEQSAPAKITLQGAHDQDSPSLSAEIGELVLLYINAGKEEREIILGTARSTQTAISGQAGNAANES